MERDYDVFADTGTYDETFDEWGYVGPETAAAILKNYVPRHSRILDAACGSGLTGTALKNLGYAHIEGIDISARLLDIAERTGAYEQLSRVDMQSFPLPFEDGAFDAVNFIGALTYFETNEILRELCRIVRRGGHVVFSQRDDIMRDQHYGEQLDELERAVCGGGSSEPSRCRISRITRSTARVPRSSTSCTKCADAGLAVSARSGRGPRCRFSRWRTSALG